jgi:membrane protease YdiL (CAAX protease family)
VIFGLSRLIYSGPILFVLAPTAIVLLVERRTVATLGFRFDPQELVVYVFYAVVGFVLLMLELILEVYLRRELGNEIVDLSGPASYGKEFIGQILFVGGPEEVFYRGYLMNRLADLLGNMYGLCLSSLLFALEHFLSRYFRHGSTLTSALRVGASAVIGGCVFGWQFQRTKSILPSLVTHVAQNLFGYVITAFILGA